MESCNIRCASGLCARAPPFLIFFNNISSVVSNSTVKLFADDITIYKEIVCPRDVDLLQLDLSKVVQWTKTWMLHLNPEKCESIVISNKKLPPVPKYCMDSKLISFKSVILYLGILVDCHLNWNDHSKYVAAKATRSLVFVFKRIKAFACMYIHKHINY